MAPFKLIFLVAFFLCEALAAFWNPEPYRVRLVALGLTCFAASLLFG